MSNHSRTPLISTSHFSKEALRLNPLLAGGATRTDGFTPATRPEFGKVDPLKGKGSKVPTQVEQRMLDICAARQRRGEILSYRYEGLTMKWGRDPKTNKPMRYTPDVVVQSPDKRWLMIEVKGAKIWDRDLTRFRGCRAEWPEHDFEMWQYLKREWIRIE